MSDPRPQQSIPAGWYPDPDPRNPGGSRWWDGQRWTEHVQPGPQQQAQQAAQQAQAQQAQVQAQQTQAQPQTPQQNPSQAPAQHQSAAAEPPQAPAQPQIPTPPVQPQAPVAQAPVGQGPAGGYAQGGQPGMAPVHPGAQPGMPGTAYGVQAPHIPPKVAPGTSALTPWVWIIIGLPLLPVLIFMFVDFAHLIEVYVRFVAETRTGYAPAPGVESGLDNATTNLIGTIVLIDLLGFVIYGINVLFAFFDHRALARRGVVRPFHWAWGFFGGLVYVIGRVVVTWRRGAALSLWPLWALIAVFVLSWILMIVKIMLTLNGINVYYDSGAAGYSSSLFLLGS
jgi:hypothetical protein